MYACEHCGRRFPSIWAASYCCDPWPAEDDERDIRRARNIRFPNS